MPLLDTPYNRQYTPPKPFSQGSWNYNGGNPMAQYGMAKNPAPHTGVSYQAPQQSGGMVRTQAPAMGMSSTDYGGNQDVFTAQPFANRTMSTQQPALPNQDINTPMPQFGQTQAMPQYQPSGFNTQYGTFGNIQDYMNPYLDQTIERGNKNILANASARGLLGSTGTGNELGDWAAQAQSDAYNDAFGRFTQDRGYMTDVYKDQRNFDYGNYMDTNAMNLGIYRDERDDYRNRMNDWYSQMNGVVGTGINATNNSADVYGNFFNALAGLYGERGNVGANQAIQGGNNNANFIQGLIGLLGMGGG